MRKLLRFDISPLALAPLCAFIAFLAAASVLFSGCASTGFNSQTGPGFIYADHYEGAMITDHPAGRKRGQSCTTNYFGMITSGDASISAAMKDGAITTVSSVDHSFKNILSLYGKMCTIVTGN